MAQTPGQQRAADAVAAELASRGWTNSNLRDATGELDGNDTPVDLGTIGDFLSYRRWPKIGTLGKFERVFGWPAGSLRKLALNGEPIPSAEPDESVGTATQTDSVPAWNTRRPEGMTDEEHKRIVREAEEFYRFLIERAGLER